MEEEEDLVGEGAELLSAVHEAGAAALAGIAGL